MHCHYYSDFQQSRSDECDGNVPLTQPWPSQSAHCIHSLADSRDITFPTFFAVWPSSSPSCLCTTQRSGHIRQRQARQRTVHLQQPFGFNPKLGTRCHC
jgi:hypothetical protein